MEGVYFLIYCLIGCIFNGILNEDWQPFSLVLMFLWPFAVFMWIFVYIIYLFVSIGKAIKKYIDN